MGTWETIWKVIVWVALTSYFGLAFVIAVGGFFDVRKMFQRLNAQHARDNQRYQKDSHH
jgi:hypothetical protein